MINADTPEWQRRAIIRNVRESIIMCCLKGATLEQIRRAFPKGHRFYGAVTLRRAMRNGDIDWCAEPDCDRLVTQTQGYRRPVFYCADHRDA